MMLFCSFKASSSMASEVMTGTCVLTARNRKFKLVGGRINQYEETPLGLNNIDDLVHHQPQYFIKFKCGIENARDFIERLQFITLAFEVADICSEQFALLLKIASDRRWQRHGLNRRLLRGTVQAFLEGEQDTLRVLIEPSQFKIGSTADTQ